MWVEIGTRDFGSIRKESGGTDVIQDGRRKVLTLCMEGVCYTMPWTCDMPRRMQWCLLGTCSVSAVVVALFCQRGY